MAANKVLSPRELQDHDVGRCGGKAASLDKLLRMGATVPPGFCVLAEALDETLASNDLHAPIAEIGASLDFEDFVAVEKSTGVIREMIANDAIPSPVSDAIRERYQERVTPAGARR